MHIVHGDYLVVDQYNHRVQLCPAASPGFPCQTVAGMLEQGSDANQLATPRDVVVTSEGDYLIADELNGRVQLCPAASPGADCVTVADVASGVRGPAGVAIDADGNLIVVDRSSNRVLRCLPASAASGCDIVAGGSRGSGDTQFRYPEKILIDTAGDYVIADSSNHRIQLCPGSSPGSPCITVVGTGTAGSGATELNWPRGIALTAEGDYVVADRFNHRIQRCAAASPGTDCETIAGGSQGGGLPQLDGPEDVAIAADGDLLIADSGNHRLQRCVVGGLCVTVFGGYGTGLAEFKYPASVVIVNSVTTTVSTTFLSTSNGATSRPVSTPQATAAVASGEHISKLSFTLCALMMAILVDVWI